MSVFEFKVRIYYEDTDFTGMVYHANYLRYFERGRTEGLRAQGIGHAELMDQDPARMFTVRSLNIDYLRPARIDDFLTIQTKVLKAKGAQLLFDQCALRGEELLAQASVQVVCIDAAGRPKRLPAGMLDAFALAN